MAGINLFNCFVILALSKRLRISLRSGLNRVSFGFALIPMVKAKSASNDHNRRGHTANNGEVDFFMIVSPFPDFAPCIWSFYSFEYCEEMVVS